MIGSLAMVHIVLNDIVARDFHWHYRISLNWQENIGEYHLDPTLERLFIWINGRRYKDSVQYLATQTFYDFKVSMT